ncbi:MAG: hypothetical protein SGCHY_002008 [Lobulomycetales sp.]
MRVSPRLRINRFDAMSDKRSAKEVAAQLHPLAVPHQAYTRLTLADAAAQTGIPTYVQMLGRDFIHNSLYHPSYGYFSKRAKIFSPDHAIPFNEIRDNYAFMNYISKMYKARDDRPNDNEARQIWHTPTELFTPHYGHAVARYILKQYKQDPRGSPLLIYEIGAGNGTLMCNILDYLYQHDPRVYAECRYTVIEISPQLLNKQRRNMPERHRQRVQIIGKSVFEWDTLVPESCFVMAMEVIDNFAHDIVRWEDETLLQGLVLIDGDGDFSEAFEQARDPLLKRYFDLSPRHRYHAMAMAHPLAQAKRPKSIREHVENWVLPWTSAMSAPEFVPTMQLRFFDTLSRYFPRHRLILSDFDALPDSMDGINAPVVQTRYNGLDLPCPAPRTSYTRGGLTFSFVSTDFHAMRDVYAGIMHSNGVEKRGLRVMSQQEFLMSHAGPDILAKTRTRLGENPMLGFYRNFSFLVSE